MVGVPLDPVDPTSARKIAELVMERASHLRAPYNTAVELIETLAIGACSRALVRVSLVRLTNGAAAYIVIRRAAGREPGAVLSVDVPLTVRFPPQ